MDAQRRYRLWTLVRDRLYALAGTGQIAPSCVQQRTMSRTDRIPTISP